MKTPTLYDDGRIACDDDRLIIRWYYLWGAKRIRYSSIVSATRFELSMARGKWRIWGSGDLRHWYNLDGKRPKKTTGIDIDLGKWIRPRITPDDVDAVMGIIEGHSAS